MTRQSHDLDRRLHDGFRQLSDDFGALDEDGEVFLGAEPEAELSAEEDHELELQLEALDANASRSYRQMTQRSMMAARREWEQRHKETA